MTEGRRKQMLLVATQLSEARNGSVTCATCDRCNPTWVMYRCFYCGLFFCEKCCPNHFGKTRAEYRQQANQ